MTENEIINILKENKARGVAYMFLLEDVWDWIEENFKDPKLMYLAPDGKWESFSKTGSNEYDDYNNVIFALPDDYKKESKGEWVEFEIDKNGQFIVEFCKGSLDYCYDWFNWWKLLEKSKEYDYGFTAFGGWQYQNCKAWFMQPMLFQEDHYITNEFENEPFKTEPAIPIKIRFWRK